jgi:hypothetical protein
MKEKDDNWQKIYSTIISTYSQFNAILLDAQRPVKAPANKRKAETALPTSGGIKKERRVTTKPSKKSSKLMNGAEGGKTKTKLSEPLSQVQHEVPSLHRLPSDIAIPDIPGMGNHTQGYESIGMGGDLDFGFELDHSDSLLYDSNDGSNTGLKNFASQEDLAGNMFSLDKMSYLDLPSAAGEKNSYQGGNWGLDAEEIRQKQQRMSRSQNSMSKMVHVNSDASLQHGDSPGMNIDGSTQEEELVRQQREQERLQREQMEKDANANNADEFDFIWGDM